MNIYIHHKKPVSPVMLRVIPVFWGMLLIALAATCFAGLYTGTGCVADNARIYKQLADIYRIADTAGYYVLLLFAALIACRKGTVTTACLVVAGILLLSAAGMSFVNVPVSELLGFCNSFAVRLQHMLTAVVHTADFPEGTRWWNAVQWYVTGVFCITVAVLLFRAKHSSAAIVLVLFGTWLIAEAVFNVCRLLIAADRVALL
jgi:hypothetical protein